MFDSLYNWVISVWTTYGDTIIEVGKFLAGLSSIGFTVWKVVQKQVQKYSFFIAIAINIIFILFPFIRLVSSDEPFGRIDVALIAFYVFCLMSVIFMCLIKWARDKTVYQAKLKYDLFYTGDIDVPDIEVIPQKKNRTEP